MTPAISTYHSDPTARPFDPSLQRAIEIDYTTITEWCGIDPDREIVSDWMANKTLAVVDANTILDTMNLEKSEFEGDPSVRFTFKSAIKLVVTVVNRNMKLGSREPFLPLFCPAAGGYLLERLSNIETERPDLIPTPPFYGGRICSAVATDHRYWTSAVLQFLYERGNIQGYGRQGARYWVS